MSGKTGRSGRQHRCPACRTTLIPRTIAELTRTCSVSRFATGKFICSPCGTREAVEGFFWADYAKKRGYKLNSNVAKEWCTFCKRKHIGGATCMGHYP
jgi:hypothetical protein